MQREWKEVFGMDILAMDANERSDVPEAFQLQAAREARAFHRQIENYQSTPLVRLSGLAAYLGVKEIFVKDESKRFSLNAFKGLGGSYAMFRILCEHLGMNPGKTTLADLQTEKARKEIGKMVFVTATDGNHGRGVAWAGKLFGCQVHVYMPAGSVEIRAEAIRKAGPAQVTITDRNYDETVKFAVEQSEKNGWYLIQDTSWDGYQSVPTWIVQGYLTMAAEALEQMEEAKEVPTHVFLQAGVGAMAGGVLGYIASYFGEKKPLVAIVEPEEANCIFRSIVAGDGEPHSVEGDPVTIMAGLNCGTPCGITWPVLRDYAEFYMSCPDYAAAHGMRLYAQGLGQDEKVISGESGAATLGVMSLVMTQPELQQIKEAMGLTENSVVLLFNTEGDTDPTGYENIVKKGAYPVPKEPYTKHQTRR